MSYSIEKQYLESIKDYPESIKDDPATEIRCTDYLTHHAIFQTEAPNGSGGYSTCVFGIQVKDGSVHRQCRTSPILFFFEHRGLSYAYTHSGSVYSLGEKLSIEELKAKWPGGRQ